MLNLHTMLPRIWSGKRRTGLATRILVIPVLALASLPYRAVISLRNRFYERGFLKQTKLPCPVISIGNITVGGTGKTPLTIMLANLLRERGYRPAVLSRGYGGTGHSLCIVSDGHQLLATAVDAGDEPMMIAKSLRNIPVITGANRIKTGEYAINTLGVNVLILDDAFQHRSLFRDLDIVLLRYRKPFGNGNLLPYGPLREPQTALKRADIIVLTSGTAKTGDSVAAALLPQFPPHFRGCYRPTTLLAGGKDPLEPWESLKGRKICAFAGIGNPASFRETLVALGGEIVAFPTFPDHHPYAAADIDEIQRTCAASGADIIVTTEKDGIRLADYPSFLQEVFLLRVEMDILPHRTEFADLVLNKLHLPAKAAV